MSRKRFIDIYIPREIRRMIEEIKKRPHSRLDLYVSKNIYDDSWLTVLHLASDMLH